MLRELDGIGVRNAIIALDNAKYHRTKPLDTPKYGDRKAVLHEACDKYNIAYDSSDTKSVLWSRLKQHIAAHIQPLIVSMAAQAGHTVQYTPPHHSDLQPIEMIWAAVKGEVGRQYSASTKFEQVRNRLDKAFENLSAATIKGCINSAEAKLLKLTSEVHHIDNQDSFSDEDSNDDDSFSEIEDAGL
ncbi:hypothetical protein AC1031_016615 [Aphanomyces cochlioides]|nr:hypothetical protein AC1031_016615 [Aphanomyces cochlioides]